MTNTETMEVLNVYLLGGFRMAYGGREVTLGRNAISKFTQLLQIVWLCADEGITKERLMYMFYDGAERANTNNSMNNLIYQMRRQMVKSGLPQRDYIVKKKGLYYPDPEVPLELDVERFREEVAAARAAEAPEEECAHYQAAFDLYEGDLLPEQASEIWVVTRSVALQGMFDETVKKLGDYYKEAGDYDSMYSVYQKAAEIYPDRDWQVGQIESLILRGEYKEAYKLYDRTVRYYEDEMGVTPPQRLLACYHEMSEKLVNEPGRIDGIRESLLESRKEVSATDDGAYGCSYPSFIDAYHIMRRNMERNGESVYMMLCTLVDYEGKLFRNQEKRNDRSEALRESVRVALRQGDVFCKYNDSQYLLLLVGTSREDCAIVHRRIRNLLRERAGDGTDVKYSVVSLADLREPEERVP